MKRPARRTAATLSSVVALAAVVAGTVGGSSPAMARQANTFKICAKGNYAAYAVLPQQDGLGTVIAPPGTCRQVWAAPETTYAEVWGIWNTHPLDRFSVGTLNFSGNAGWTGGAAGTTTSPRLVDLN